MAGFYVVSGDADKIVPVGEFVVPEGEDIILTYETAAEAGDAIKRGTHGDEIGPRYVLWVTTEVAATYDRPWVLVRMDGIH